MRRYILMVAVACAVTTTGLQAGEVFVPGPLDEAGRAIARTEPGLGPVIGEIGGIRVHAGTSAAAVVYGSLIERLGSGDGGGGDVSEVDILQTRYSDPDAGNVVLILWAEIEDNPTGVRVTLIDETGTELGSVDSVGLNPGPPTNLVFLSQVPEGVHTVRITSLDDATESEDSMLIVPEQPFGDVQDLTCDEGEAPGDGTCQLVVRWEPGEPIATYYSIIVNDVTQTQRDGADESVVLEGAPPDDYVTVNLGFLENEDGFYRGSFVETTCTLTCTANPSNSFIRGVCNGDGVAPQITSAVFGLNYLFAGGTEPPCVLACDFDADASVAINDMIGILSFLFQGGSPPVGWPGNDATCEVGPIESCATPNPSCPL